MHTHPAANSQNENDALIAGIRAAQVAISTRARCAELKSTSVPIAGDGGWSLPSTIARQAILALTTARLPLDTPAMQEAMSTYGRMLVEQELGAHVAPPEGVSTHWSSLRASLVVAMITARAHDVLPVLTGEPGEDDYLDGLAEAEEHAGAALDLATERVFNHRPGNLHELLDKKVFLDLDAIDEPDGWLDEDLAFLAKQGDAQAFWDETKFERDLREAFEAAGNQSPEERAASRMRYFVGEVGAFSTLAPGLVEVLWKIAENARLKGDLSDEMSDEAVIQGLERSPDLTEVGWAAVYRDIQRLAGIPSDGLTTAHAGDDSGNG